MGISLDEALSQGLSYRFHIQKLTDIHLRSHTGDEIEANGNIIYIYIFIVIASFILLLACINYMNLSTAYSVYRSMEVGVRKTLGSNRLQLIVQFLIESILLTVIAVVIGILMVVAFLPWFNHIMDVSLEFKGSLLPYLALSALVIGLISGSYPAFFLSAYQPLTILRSGAGRTSSKFWLRNILVVLQFTVSIIILCGTFIIKKQIDYMQNKNLGLNPDQLIIVEKTDDIAKHLITFKEKLLEHPSISSVSNTNFIPGRKDGLSYNVWGVSGESSVEKFMMVNVFADNNFLETYQVSLESGRYFSHDFGTDTISVVINQATVKAFGLENPLEEHLEIGTSYMGDKSFKIIGVIEDFHFVSLHQEIQPMAIFSFGANAYGDLVNFGKFVAVRSSAEDIKNVINHIEKSWRTYTSDQALEYVFFDEDFAMLYTAEQKTQRLITLFSLLAILIASMGALGLASFTAEQRTKEIGIRKVMGASVPGIALLLSRDVIKLVVIAIIISLPVSIYALNKWLENFAYRISFSVLDYVIAAVLALVVAITAISLRTIRAAASNPIDSIKYE